MRVGGDDHGAVSDGADQRRDDDARDLIGGSEERIIEIVDYRAEWPERFHREKMRIEAALGPTARRVEHVGSTAVPGLAAKPIVDVMVSVDEPEDESSYLPALEDAGYVLRLREPGHRMFRTPKRDVHVHVWRAGSDDELRHLLFRDRLRVSPDDRAQYELVKRELAGQFRDMNAYADAKSEVIHKITTTARTAVSLPASLRWLEAMPAGRAWLDSLPTLVDECCKRWHLECGSPYPDSHVSLVLPVRTPPGADAVLKLQYPHAEAEHEAAALAAWGGRGAVLLLGHAPELHALLIERCVPGAYLSDVGPDGALDVLIELLPRLCVPPPPQVRSLEDEARRWATHLPDMWDKAGRPFEVALLDTALEILSTLPGSQGAQVLVHQDLHAHNVLRAQREPWLAIDPKPLAGEIEFAVAPIIRSRELGHSAGAVARRLDRLTAALGLDRERARGWAIAQTLAWAFQGTTVLPHHLNTATWLVAT